MDGKLRLDVQISVNPVATGVLCPPPASLLLAASQPFANAIMRLIIATAGAGATAPGTRKSGGTGAQAFIWAGYGPGRHEEWRGGRARPRLNGAVEAPNWELKGALMFANSELLHMNVPSC